MASGKAKAFLGRENPSVRRPKCAVKALLDPMVGEACAHVQGESLKAHAALLTEASQLPDHQAGGGRYDTFSHLRSDNRRPCRR